MTEQQYLLIKLTFGVFATIGLYSVLYRENRFYRFWEHIFLGLAAGWTLVAIWTEQLKDKWWDKMVGAAAEPGTPAEPGYWAYAMLVPVGLMAYFVFSKRNNWISRIPIGIILGLWSGQQIANWWREFGPQILAAQKPIIPTKLGFTPDTSNMDAAAAAAARNEIYLSTAINNFLFVATVVCVLSYFLFSFEAKSKVVRNASTIGRYLLMIGFGAIFGSTVLMRFTLLIDRMNFIWIEWLRDGVLKAITGSR